jgi:hypothetical protein
MNSSTSMLFFRTINGSTITVDWIPSTDTVFDLKIKLANIMNRQPESLKIIVKGKYTSDNSLMSIYEPQKLATIHVI